MKNIFSLTLIIFYFSISLAQDKAVLTMRDGTTIERIGDYYIGSKGVKFKKRDNEEKKFYDYKQLKKVIEYTENYNVEYEFKILKTFENQGYFRLLRKVKDGNVNLYVIAAPSMVTMGSTAAGTITGSTYNPSQVNYYCSKEEEDVVTELGKGNTYSRKFRKLAKEYFSDCPELIDKIASKGFQKMDIIGVFDYYYKKCNIQN